MKHCYRSISHSNGRRIQKNVKTNIFGAYRFANDFETRFCKQKRGGLFFLVSLAGYYVAPAQAADEV